MELQFKLISNVFGGVEVRALCRSPEFIYSIINMSYLRDTDHVTLEQVWAFSFQRPKTSYSIVLL